MARTTITPVHDDATPCQHPVTSTGRPRDPQSGCTGRTAYALRCSCGWEPDGGPTARVVQNDRAAGHKRTAHGA